MNASPNDSRYGKRRGGGQPGNTNGQTHGLFSRLHPPAVATLTAIADAAIAAEDLPTLRRIERAMTFHRLPEHARITRAARLLIETATIAPKERSNATGADTCVQYAPSHWSLPHTLHPHSGNP